MTDVVRLYAKVVGASVILIGLVGLVLGDKSLYLIHLTLGVLGIVVGFFVGDRRTTADR